MSGTTPPPIPDTLVGFLRAAGAALRVYDMGRRVRPVTPRDVLAFERTERPYPYPLRRAAWLGLLFWMRGCAQDPYLWFLKFPLDERGLLVQAGRDYFLRRLLEAYGARLRGLVPGRAGAPSALEDNPFTFRPADARLAVFRAKSARELSLPPSRYYDPARAYLCGCTAAQAWLEVGMQGVADFAARLDLDDNRRRLAGSLGDLPAEPFVALCGCLESERLPAELARVVQRRAREALRGPSSGPASAAVVAAAVRAVGWSRATRVSGELVDAVLGAEVGSDIEVLASIAGRAWEMLDDAPRRRRYFERLARSPAGQVGFDAIASDLLFLPGLREPVLQTFRAAGRSQRLAERIDALLSRLREEAS